MALRDDQQGQDREPTAGRWYRYMTVGSVNPDGQSVAEKYFDILAAVMEHSSAHGFMSLHVAKGIESYRDIDKHGAITGVVSSVYNKPLPCYA